MSTTPYEMWNNKKPTLKFLRIFGATAYVHNNHANGKLDKKAIKGILVGYTPSGYRIFFPDSRMYGISKDVTFDERTFMQTRPTAQITQATSWGMMLANTAQICIMWIS